MIGATSDIAGIDPWLLERLVCPATRGALRWDAANGELVSDPAGLAYPVRDGVPVLLVEEARRLPGSARAGITAPDED